MEGDKHIPLKDLIARLRNGVDAVNSGEASKEEVSEMLTLSRELHERLAVLRFKAFESSAQEEQVEEEDKCVSEAQIDLIDAIEEVSLVEQQQRNPLSSVGEGLTILERANFTSILFSNDDNGFNDMLDNVDDCNSVDEATKLFRKSINPYGRKEDVDLAIKSFEERIPRIF